MRYCRNCRKKVNKNVLVQGCCSSLCIDKRKDYLKNRLINKNIRKEASRKLKEENAFTLLDQRWLELRYKALIKYGRKCLLCGSCDKLHVDHVLPKSKYPERAYDLKNLQILCAACNLGKSNKHTHDFRPKEDDSLNKIVDLFL